MAFWPELWVAPEEMPNPVPRLDIDTEMLRPELSILLALEVSSEFEEFAAVELPQALGFPGFGFPLGFPPPPHPEPFEFEDWGGGPQPVVPLDMAEVSPGCGAPPSKPRPGGSLQPWRGGVATPPERNAPLLGNTPRAGNSGLEERQLLAPAAVAATG